MTIKEIDYRMIILIIFVLICIYLIYDYISYIMCVNDCKYLVGIDNAKRMCRYI